MLTRPIGLYQLTILGAIQVLHNVVRSVTFPRKKRYESVRFNDISVTRG